MRSKTVLVIGAGIGGIVAANSSGAAWTEGHCDREELAHGGALRSHQPRGASL